MNSQDSVIQWLLHLALRARLLVPARALTRRDRAFHEYARHLIKAFAAPPITLTVRSGARHDERRTGKSVVKLELDAPDGVMSAPGDLLHVHWENDPETVEAVRSLLGECPFDSLPVWEGGSAYRPARRQRLTPDALLRRFLDLSTPSQRLLRLAGLDPLSPGAGETSLVRLLKHNRPLAGWLTLANHQTRMKPRLYTLARTGERRWEILAGIHRQPGKSVTPNSSGGRASSHLARLRQGDSLTARLLRHPHRLPPAYGHTGPGLIVATGTAIAITLASLRAGADLSNSHLYWGVPNAAIRHFLAPDLEHFSTIGRIGSVRIAESLSPSRPKHVQDLLTQDPIIPNTVLSSANGWIHVAGHHPMAESVLPILRQAAQSSGHSNDWPAQWLRDMRAIESTS